MRLPLFRVCAFAADVSSWRPSRQRAASHTPYPLYCVAPRAKTERARARARDSALAPLQTGIFLNGGGVMTPSALGIFPPNSRLRSRQHGAVFMCMNCGRYLDDPPRGSRVLCRSCREGLATLNESREERIVGPQPAICADPCCGRPFTAARWGHRFCCPSHRMHAWRAAQRAALLAGPLRGDACLR
jgi:hypothetical protein